MEAISSIVNVATAYSFALNFALLRESAIPFPFNSSLIQPSLSLGCCVAAHSFFSRHLLMLVIIAVQFEISGKPRQKNIRFLYLSLGREITRVRDLCHICIFMMCALRCDLCFNVLLRLTESNRNIRAVCQVHKLLEIRLKLRFFTGFNIYMSAERTLVQMSIIMLRHFTFFVKLNGCDRRIREKRSCTSFWEIFVQIISGCVNHFGTFDIGFVEICTQTNQGFKNGSILQHKTQYQITTWKKSIGNKKSISLINYRSNSIESSVLRESGSQMYACIRVWMRYRMVHGLKTVLARIQHTGVRRVHYVRA